jgi:hypothetical protein
MYRFLAEARQQATGDVAVGRRLDHLTLYTRYVELFRAYEIASGDQRQAAFEQLIRHVYRIRTTMMVHAKAIYRDLDRRDKSVTIPAENAWNKPESGNDWKSSESWKAEEIASIARAGIDANPTIAFKPQTFSRDLRPLSDAPDLRRIEDSHRGRGTQVFYTWAGAAGAKSAAPGHRRPDRALSRPRSGARRPAAHCRGRKRNVRRQRRERARWPAAHDRADDARARPLQARRQRRA